MKRLGWIVLGTVLIGGGAFAATRKKKKKTPAARVLVLDERRDLDVAYQGISDAVRLTADQLGQPAGALAALLKDAVVLMRVPADVLLDDVDGGLRSVDELTAGLAESMRDLWATGVRGIVVIPPIRAWTGAYAETEYAGRILALRRGSEMLTAWLRSQTAPVGHESDPLFNAVVSLDGLLAEDGIVRAELSDATGLNAAGLQALGTAIRTAVDEVRR